MLSFVTHFFQFIFLFSDKLCQHVKSFMRVCRYWKGTHGLESLRKTNKLHFLNVSAKNWIQQGTHLYTKDSSSPEKTEWGPLFVKAGWVYPLSSSAQALHASAARDHCWPSPLQLSLLPQLSLSSQRTSSPQSGCINACVPHTAAQSRRTPPTQHPCKKHTLFLLWRMMFWVTVHSNKHPTPKMSISLRVLRLMLQ